MKKIKRMSSRWCIFSILITSAFGCATILPKNTAPLEHIVASEQNSEAPAPIASAIPEPRHNFPLENQGGQATPMPRASDMLAYVRLAPQDAARATLTKGDYGYSNVFEFGQEFIVSFTGGDQQSLQVQVSLPQDKEIKLFHETPKYKILELVDEAAMQKSDSGTTLSLKEKGRYLITAGSESVTFENDTVPEIIEQATESITVFEHEKTVQRVIQSLNEYGVDSKDRRIGLLCMPGYGMENSHDHSGYGRFLRYAATRSSRRDRFSTTFKSIVFNGLSESPSYENGKLALSSVVYKDKRRYVLFAFSKGGLDSRGMQLADYWSGKRYIAGKVTAGTPHHGSILANYEDFQLRASKEPAPLGLCAAYVGATAKSFGALRTTLSKVPIKDIVDKPRGRLWKNGFNDLSYDGVLPQIPVLPYRFSLLSGIEVARKLTPDSRYLSQCNQSPDLFSLPGGSGIAKYLDENKNCYYNYVQALGVLEKEARFDGVKDTFYHGAYRTGEGLTDARDQFLKKILRPSGLSLFLAELGREAKKAAQDFITTVHATMPIYTADRISPFAANDSLVALFSALNSLPSAQSLIDITTSTYESIKINMSAVDARKATNALGQYIWKDRRHSELLGYSDDEDSAYVKDKELYEMYLDNLFALADKVEREKITSITFADRDTMFTLFKEWLRCVKDGEVLACEAKEMMIVSAQYMGNNIAKMRVNADWGPNHRSYEGTFEKIGATWTPHTFEQVLYVPYFP